MANLFGNWDNSNIFTRPEGQIDPVSSRERGKLK